MSENKVRLLAGGTRQHWRKSGFSSHSMPSFPPGLSCLQASEASEASEASKASKRVLQRTADVFCEPSAITSHPLETLERDAAAANESISKQERMPVHVVPLSGFEHLSCNYASVLLSWLENGALTSLFTTLQDPRFKLMQPSKFHEAGRSGLFLHGRVHGGAQFITKECDVSLGYSSGHTTLFLLLDPTVDGLREFVNSPPLPPDG